MSDAETFISETPGVCGGYPCIGDTRVRVALVIDALAATDDPAYTAQLFDLTVDQVLAARRYYEARPENRARVDEDIRRNLPSSVVR